MTTPTTAELLKYADLQMAAEAFLVDPLTGTPKDLKQALIDGNNRSSVFTATQAKAFADRWRVVDQRANTPTGFSGTLFEAVVDDPAAGIKAGELVMSFRSTEFVDDAARDNQATNALEIKETGFAWGQMRDMQKWYQDLQTSGQLPAGQPFTLTGYSLGGHLANAFNTIYPGAAQKTYTFNGAGIGGVAPTTSLKALLTQFTTDSTSDFGANITNASLKATYARVKAALKTQSAVSNSDTAELNRLANPGDKNTSIDFQTSTQATDILKAIGRINTLQKEIVRLKDITSGTAAAGPTQVANDQIVQQSLDYQMAVLAAAKFTDATGLLAGLSRAYNGKPSSQVTVPNQFDIVGSGTPSAVANSQWHIGQDVQVFIEDQPLYRGGVVADVLLQSLKYLDVKLLVNEFVNKDFGDTHSLVLLVDSLNVQNTLLQSPRCKTAKYIAARRLPASVKRRFGKKMGPKPCTPQQLKPPGARHEHPHPQSPNLQHAPHQTGAGLAGAQCQLAQRMCQRPRFERRPPKGAGHVQGGQCLL